MGQQKRNPHWSVVCLRISLSLNFLKLVVVAVLLEVDFMVVEVLEVVIVVVEVV